VAVEAGLLAEANLRGERLRTRNRLWIDFDADDRTPRSADHAQRGRSPARGNVQDTRLRPYLQETVEAIVVRCRYPAALAEIIIIDFGEDRILKLPQIGGVSELVEIRRPGLIVGHITHPRAAVGAPCYRPPIPLHLTDVQALGPSTRHSRLLRVNSTSLVMSAQRRH
jgi:hypothetical protein